MGAVAVLSVAALAVCAGGCQPTQRVSRGAEVTIQEDSLPLPCPALSCEKIGLETCFDARDDDCDGLVDEGCGLPVSVLQIVVAWDDPATNLDLEVTDPRGEVAQVGEPTTLGLVRDRDCPGVESACGGQNVEVVTIDRDAVPEGRFLVRLVRRWPANPKDPLVIRLGGHRGTVPLVGTITLKAEERERQFLIEQLTTDGNCASLPGS